jgi:hypothetical protein
MRIEIFSLRPYLSTLAPEKFSCSQERQQLRLSFSPSPVSHICTLLFCFTQHVKCPYEAYQNVSRGVRQMWALMNDRCDTSIALWLEIMKQALKTEGKTLSWFK